jgi:transcription elongation factor GreA-like protein
VILPRNRSMERQFLLVQSFSSSERETYLNLCDAIIKLSDKAKRRRLAARLQAEVGDYLARTGDVASAIPIFKQVLKRYRVDQWDRSHFWRLFRLEYCQRRFSKPTEYLKSSLMIPNSGNNRITNASGQERKVMIKKSSSVGESVKLISQSGVFFPERLI